MEFFVFLMNFVSQVALHKIETVIPAEVEILKPTQLIRFIYFYLKSPDEGFKKPKHLTLANISTYKITP